MLTVLHPISVLDRNPEQPGTASTAATNTARPNLATAAAVPTMPITPARPAQSQKVPASPLASAHFRELGPTLRVVERPLKLALISAHQRFSLRGSPTTREKQPPR